MALVRWQPYLILDVRDEDEWKECHIMEGTCFMCWCCNDLLFLLVVPQVTIRGVDTGADHNQRLLLCCPSATAVSYPAPRISQDRITPQLFSYVRMRLLLWRFCACVCDVSRRGAL